MRHLLAGVVLNGLVILGTSAFASAQDTTCSPINDLAVKLAVPRLMSVVAGALRVHFLRGSDKQAGCPGSLAICTATGYLVAGDTVIVTSMTKDYMCAAYTGPEPGFNISQGWLPSSTLMAAQAKGLATNEQTGWLGDWKSSSDREIKIKSAPGGKVTLDVSSTFAGRPMGTNGKDTPGYLATITIHGDRAAFSLDIDKGDTQAFDADPKNTDLCRARLWRLGDFLVLADNGCRIPESGTATGIYRMLTRR